MERSSTVAVLACLLLVVSGGVVPSTAWSVRSSTAEADIATSPPLPTNNTSARLHLPDDHVTQSQFEGVRIRMGSTLQAGSDSARRAHQRLTIERKFESADSIDEKRTVIDQTLIKLRDRLAELEARERAVISSYSDGDIDGETLTRELARIDASAREIGTTLELVRSLAANKAITVFDGRIKGIRFQAESLQGPVRNWVARTMAGDVRPSHDFVTASDTGVVLSALIGDTYVREATDYRYRRTDGENNIDSSTDRAEELYPWAWNNRDYSDITGALTTNIYRITIPHTQGELVAYMDTRSADIFHEVQRLTVADMPTTSTVNRSGNGLRVTLERTYEGGPVHVFVEDASTGAAVNAEVTVDDHLLGRTGTDGHVRTIEPRGSYTVNVSDGDTTLSFTVDPDESED